MKSVWEYLHKRQIESYLGQELLERLEHILPVLRQGAGLVGDSIYETRNLARLFEVFCAPALMRTRTFRAELYNALPPDDIDRLVRANGKDPTALPDFSAKVDFLASKRWRDESARDFARVFELSPHLIPTTSPGSPECERVDPVGRLPLKRLKDFQFRAFLDCAAELAHAHGRAVLQMPTGSGKTRTAMEVIAAFLQSRQADGRCARVAWLAHSGELCDQAMDAFLEVWPHYASDSLDVYRCWGKNRGVPPPPVSQWFWVTSLQMAHILREQDRLPKADLIVVDEAHKVLAPTYYRAVRALLGQETRVLGLTATPGRGADVVDENRALAEFFFDRKITLTVDSDSVISFLRDRGVLAKVTYEELRTSATVDLNASERRNLGEEIDLPERVLKKLADDDLRTVEIAKRVLNHARAGSSILVFATSVEHSKFLAALLTYLGLTASHLDGTTPASQRRGVIELFRARKIQVLCNFGVLTTGFDAPNIDVLCVARPTTSIVLYSQMIGRGLRGPAIGGTEHCTVIDVRDNIVGLPEPERIHTYFDEYFTEV